MTRTIGILLTSNDTSEFSQRFPDDGEKFKALLQPLRPDWRFETIPVKDGVLPVSATAYDGYVITGSPASVNGGEPWIAALLAFIRELHAKGIPTFGACFGHQAIALALGGAVERSTKGWGLGTAPTHFAKHAAWMTPPHDRLTLFAAHEEQVKALPPGADILGGDAFCPVGAYRIGDRIFATEYHPEMTDDFMAALIDHLEDKLTPAEIERARASTEQETQGAEFARWIVNFLEYSVA